MEDDLQNYSPTVMGHPVLKRTVNAFLHFRYLTYHSNIGMNRNDINIRVFLKIN